MKYSSTNWLLEEGTYAPSPEDEIIELEEKRQLSEIALDKMEILNKMLFREGELEFWADRVIFGLTVRKMAMKYHMSRYNIRKKLDVIETRVERLRHFFEV